MLTLSSKHLCVHTRPLRLAPCCFHTSHTRRRSHPGLSLLSIIQNHHPSAWASKGRYEKIKLYWIKSNCLEELKNTIPLRPGLYPAPWLPAGQLQFNSIWVKRSLWHLKHRKSENYPEITNYFLFLIFVFDSAVTCLQWKSCQRLHKLHLRVVFFNVLCNM